MTDFLLSYFYLYVTLEALLILGAAIYSYRLMKLTGAFRAWILMIAALSVLASGVLASYAKIMLFDSAAQIDELVHGPTPMMFVANSAYSITLSMLLFFAMFELFKIFRFRTKQEAGTSSMAVPSF